MTNKYLDKAGVQRLVQKLSQHMGEGGGTGGAKGRVKLHGTKESPLNLYEYYEPESYTVSGNIADLPEGFLQFMDMGMGFSMFLDVSFKAYVNIADQFDNPVKNTFVLQELSAMSIENNAPASYQRFIDVYSYEQPMSQELKDDYERDGCVVLSDYVAVSVPPWQEIILSAFSDYIVKFLWDSDGSSVRVGDLLVENDSEGLKYLIAIQDDVMPENAFIEDIILSTAYFDEEEPYPQLRLSYLNELMQENGWGTAFRSLVKLGNLYLLGEVRFSSEQAKQSFLDYLSWWNVYLAYRTKYLSVV